MEQQVSYLAVVTDLQQIKVHCPVCLMQSLSQALLGGMVARETNLRGVADLAEALAKVSDALRWMTATEIEAAERLLLTSIRTHCEQHTDDIPF